MLLYDPQRHPEQKMVIKTDKVSCYTGFEHGIENNLAMHFYDGDHVPHWSRSRGVGCADITFYKKSEHLSIRIFERVGDKKSGREAWITLPKEAVDALREMIKNETA